MTPSPKVAFSAIPVALLSIFGFSSCSERKIFEKGDHSKTQTSMKLESMSDCRLQIIEDELCIVYRWAKMPLHESDEGVIEVKFLRPSFLDGSLVPASLAGWRLSFEPWMIMDPPSDSHSTAPVKVYQVDVGAFRISDIYLVMRGRWELRFKLSPSEGNTSKEVSQKSFIEF